MARSNNNLKAVLQDTANAIRSKTGGNNPIVPRDFGDAIRSIPTGITPSGTLYIDENGYYNVANKAGVVVDVIPELDVEEGKLYIGTDSSAFPPLELVGMGLYEVDDYGNVTKYIVSTGTIQTSTFYVSDCSGYLNVVSAGLYSVDSSGYGSGVSFTYYDFLYQTVCGIQSSSLPYFVGDSYEFENELGRFRITRIA